ncbi:Uncharacterised protein [Mycobacteroides abscessus subsp. abscessus]|nr:Uncharacterised protein [Mycobacteroides abscessus subsp. abscessus]SIC59051.1 Uncharacterised protein [Mycobacteroides abscessus subsp. abscessus]SKK19887.1 Uncharacterised protein [Mycobacteroides abscessus subsp. abscessus]SKP49786.1 Uncharacterised protein [Mycobacteroides abscessus subsp. abscessus]SKR42184.1 Uncharacterised protein [Mycobacteroides abscessus subsp. abscessus]
MFNEQWVPYSLRDLPEGESIALTDLDGFIPYLTEKWPEGGKPHRMEMLKGPRPNPPGVSGWLVFRLPPRERPVDPTAPKIDWDAIRDARLQARTDTAADESK